RWAGGRGLVERYVDQGRLFVRVRHRMHPPRTPCTIARAFTPELTPRTTLAGIAPEVRSRAPAGLTVATAFHAEVTPAVVAPRIPDKPAPVLTTFTTKARAVPAGFASEARSVASTFASEARGVTAGFASEV
ncbi:hypothetical protein, partial [Kribbella solani]|uniref:hypothetical protein n=1 Tax=Kribbella solani TaxID=236067 RepID=UPI0029A284DD